MTAIHGYQLVEEIENFLKKYINFPSPSYVLPLALWTIATHMFESFDAFPYLCINAATKQAGKTRLAELLSFTCNQPFFTTGATAASVFHRFVIDQKSKEAGVTAPTVFFDEAEDLSKGDTGSMRSFLNSGYRKGQVIPRVGREYPSYSPKCFILIADVYDTLRDRSIIVTMRRGAPAHRFLWSVATTEGKKLHDDILFIMDNERENIAAVYPSFVMGLEFLPDRDAEIWAPLFAIADRLCPKRVTELQRISVDMATEKSAPVRKHTTMVMEEDKALDDQYAQRLLVDLNTVLTGHKALSTVDLIDKLMELPLGPWRRFKGVGLTADDMASMLRRFNNGSVRPRSIRVGRGQFKSNHNVTKGYKFEDVHAAFLTISKAEGQ